MHLRHDVSYLRTKVGEVFKGVEDLVIAKLAATANDVMESIQGFPTIIFYPKGKTSKQGIGYEGERNSKEMIDWLKEHATVDLTAIVKEEL